MMLKRLLKIYEKEPEGRPPAEYAEMYQSFDEKLNTKIQGGSNPSYN